MRSLQVAVASVSEAAPNKAASSEMRRRAYRKELGAMALHFPTPRLLYDVLDLLLPDAGRLQVVTSEDNLEQRWPSLSVALWQAVWAESQGLCHIGPAILRK